MEANKVPVTYTCPTTGEETTCMAYSTVYIAEACIDEWYELSQDFREWQRQWDLYNDCFGPKPNSVDEFIDELRLKYTLTKK